MSSLRTYKRPFCALDATVKGAVCVSLHPVLPIVIGPVTAPLGTVAVIVVSLTTVKEAVTLLENLTLFTPVKFAPVMVTLLPTAPLVGLMLLAMAQHALCNS